MNRQPSIGVFCVLVLVALAALSGCSGPTPTPAPTPAPTSPPTATPLPSPTPMPSPTASPTPLPLADWVAEGDAALAQSDFVAAEKAYRRAIEADPEYAPARASLSWLYGWLPGKERDALAEARTATELDPDSAAAWVALSDASRMRGDTPAALEAAEKALQLDPKGSRTQAVLARAYLADRQYDAARKAAEEAVTTDPESAFAYHALSRVHQSMSDYGRALAASEQAIALEPQFAPWRINLGELLTLLQRYEAANEQFEQALKLVPDFSPALLGQAWVHSLQQEYAQAEELIAKAAAAAPDAADPLVAWGLLYLPQDKPEKAAAKLSEAAKLDPENWLIEAASAQARLSQGDCESAAAAYQDLISDYPREGSLRLENTRAKWCLGDLQRALELARETTEMEPYNPDAHLMLAHNYALQQRWDQAVEAYVKAARYSPVATAAHAGLGDVYLDQDDVDALEAESRLATELDPNARDGFAGLCLAFWLKNEPEKMLAPCEQATRLDPLNEDDRARWGTALMLNGRLEEAIDVLTRNVADHPEHVLSRLNLGYANLRAKKYDAAKKELETAQKISGIDNQQLAYLILSLDQGWELREAKALELLNQVEREGGRGVIWKIESTDEVTRTLTGATKAKIGEKPEDVYQTTLTAMVVASFFLPRIAPEINGGTLVRATDPAAKPMFTLEVEADDQWGYLIAELSLEQFAERVDFVQPAGGTRSPEMTDTLVKTAGDDVAKLRGLAAEQAIPFARIQQSELEEHLEAAIEPEDRDEAHSDQLLLSLLGALDPEVDLLEAQKALWSEQTLGFYDIDDKTFYVVQDKAPGLADRMTAAHEYVHALQDQSFDIGKAQEEEQNDDRSLAYTALVEGDAQLATAQYAQEKLPVLELLQTLEAAQAEADYEKLEQSPPVLRGSAEFAYAQGLAFVQGVHDTGGWEAVNDLYKKPPASTEQVLHPERYRAGEAPVEVALPDLSKTLGTGWAVVDDNVLGELTWRLVLGELVGPASAERAAEGWGGDRYALLREGDSGPGAALVHTVWDSPENAEEFWAVIRTGLASRPEFSEVVHDLTGPALTRYFQGPDAFWIARLDGSDVTLAIGPSAETAQKLIDADK